MECPLSVLLSSPPPHGEIDCPLSVLFSSPATQGKIVSLVSSVEVFCYSG